MQLNQLIYAKLLAESQTMAFDFVACDKHFASTESQTALYQFIKQSNPENPAPLLFKMFFGSFKSMDYEESIANDLGINLTKAGVLALVESFMKYQSSIKALDMEIENSFAEETLAWME